MLYLATFLKHRRDVNQKLLKMRPSSLISALEAILCGAHILSLLSYLRFVIQKFDHCIVALIADIYRDKFLSVPQAIFIKGFILIESGVKSPIKP